MNMSPPSTGIWKRIVRWVRLRRVRSWAKVRQTFPPNLGPAHFSSSPTWLTIHSLRQIRFRVTCIVHFPPDVHEVAWLDCLRAPRAGAFSTYYLGHLAESFFFIDPATTERNQREPR